MHPAGENQTVVSEPKWLGGALLVGFPLLGAGLGWGLNLIAELITGLRWFPLQGLFEQFTELSGTVRLIVALAVGAAAGLVLALIGVHEMLTVTVDRRRLRLERGDYDRTVEAADVASVFVEDKRLVVLGRRRQELARVQFDLKRENLVEALRRHGYAWRPGGDPYEDDYRRWVPEAEGLPKGAEPLLKARQRALEKSEGKELEELRDELASLDVVLRDKDKKQYWRLSDPS
ncbi:YqeB family protein [Glycomyces salinus]|uniref:YqeB family protein n=1 Tax=Glycomyces salinus TaxID=980294 RepID=UPI0018ED0D6B|nr:hypothetical protein [Glycomyces salinus]